MYIHTYIYTYNLMTSANVNTYIHIHILICKSTTTSDVAAISFLAQQMQYTLPHIYMLSRHLR